jgi:hypothetical protein
VGERTGTGVGFGVGVFGAAAAVVGNPSASAPASPRLMCRKKVRRLSASVVVESGCRQ